MRFDEPDVREAYRRGARDCYEGLAVNLKAPQARAMTEWLTELDSWEDGDPPQPPFG